MFLGRIIELLTTDDYEVYIDKNIFKPLEMYRSYFDTTPYHLLRYRCQSYFLNGGKLEAADPDINTGITVSNGGLKAPFGDIIKYLNFLVGDPNRQVVYDKILKRSSLEEMFRPEVEASVQENHRTSIGLAFMVDQDDGMDFISHGGDQNAFKVHFYVNQKSRTAYAVALNAYVARDEHHNSAVLDSEVREHLFKNIFPLFEGGRSGK